MFDNKKNFINEAINLVKLIDEEKLESREWGFFQSIKGKIKQPSNCFISEKQIFWLRDIKDRQL